MYYTTNYSYYNYTVNVFSFYGILYKYIYLFFTNVFITIEEQCGTFYLLPKLLCTHDFSRITYATELSSNLIFL